jgi:ABC-2 type transport system permease protein
VKNAASDALVITKRQLLQLARVPELLVFSTIQPVMFVLLFRFVFGGSIDTDQPGGYVQLLMPGIFVPDRCLYIGFNCNWFSRGYEKGLDRPL